MIDLINILEDRLPGNEFETKWLEEDNHTALIVNGHYAGNYDIMSDDINSYYEFNSLEDIIKMIEHDIKVWKEFDRIKNKPM
jgi:hypothetical protein